MAIVVPGGAVRILHVLCDLSGGGAERLVVDLCRFRGAGVEVEVATVQGGGPRAAQLEDLGVRVTIGGRRPRHPGVGAVHRLLEPIRRADVVHTHLFAGDTWGRFAARLAGHRRVVTTEHNVDRDERWQPFVRALLAPTATTVAVSASVARHAWWARDVRVIENGVDLDAARPHRGGAGVLALGRCVPQKGFDVLVEALPEGMYARIAGEGPVRVEHPRVRWLGWVADPWALLAEADILVVPSRWEGFGLVAVEAMAAGVPVVASAVDGLADVVGDAGLLVPPDDPAALRDALVRLAREPALRATLVRKGHTRAQRFDIRRTVGAYEALYRALCRPTGA